MKKFLLVAHNIDLAPRINSLRVGEQSRADLMLVVGIKDRVSFFKNYLVYCHGENDGWTAFVCSTHFSVLFEGKSIDFNGTDLRPMQLHSSRVL